MWRDRGRTVLPARFRQIPAGDSPTAARAVSTVVAAASLGAGTIHLAAAPGHIAESVGLSVGFVGAAIFQIAWAAAFLREPTRDVLRLGLAVNLLIIVAWLWSRTIGLPVGSHPFVPEQIGIADGLSVVFESLVVIALMLRVAFGGAAQQRLRWLGRAAVISAVPAVGVIFLAAVVAVQAATTTHHDDAELGLPHSRETELAHPHP